MLKRVFFFFCYYCAIANAEPLPEVTEAPTQIVVPVKHDALKLENLPDHLDLYSSIDAMVQNKDGNIGKQVILDLYDCQTLNLDDLPWVQKTMIEAANKAQGHVVESSFHKFLPWGISGVVVIEESHIAIHIWPEYKYAAVDIFTCSDALGVKEAANFLIESFQSKKPIELVFTRGKGVANCLSSKP